MPHSRPVPRPGATGSAATVPVAEHVRAHHRDPSPRGSVAVHAPRNTRVGHRRTGWRSVPEMLPSAPDVTSWSFFNPAQAHVGEPAQYVSATTNTLSQNATASSCGMDLLAHPGRTSKAGWLQPMVSPSASTGRCHEDVPPPVTPTGTDAQDVEKSTTALRRALEHRGREPLTPYQSGAWEVELSRHGLQSRYPSLVQGFRAGFDLGISRIHCTYTPPNHPSIRQLNHVYSSIISNEFAAGRYIGPFTRAQLEASVGPFQTSPLSLVPKTSKPGKYRAVHDFSHPHSPLLATTSINLNIDSDEFPCTWGTFSTVFLLIARLPPGSQASVRDVAEAYRTIPAAPSQWPGLVIRLQAVDQFAVNTCNNFGLASAGGVYSMVADAGANIFRCSGIGPVAKWVDDHLFFRVPRAQLLGYNECRKVWRQEIQTSGGCRQSGSRLWYGGKDLPDGSPEEFDEDCSTTLADLANVSPRSVDDHTFAYADTDIDKISSLLGIRWEPSKSIPFGEEVPYLGFRWDLCTRRVHLLEEKRLKYLAAITDWEKVRTHNLLDTQRIYGKLLHATLVLPAGRAYLTNLEAMLALFSNGAFVPHSPPRDTASDLQWWRRQLSRSDISRPIREPSPPTDYQAYSDASSGFGVAITIGPRWRAWRLVPGWKSQGRDIQWAEAIGFEFLVRALCEISSRGEQITVYGDNRGVVEGWWKRSSANKPTNRIFRRILELSEDSDRVVHTKYVPSAQNPADGPSRGRYPPFNLLLNHIPIPSEVQPFIVDIHPE